MIKSLLHRWLIQPDLLSEEDQRIRYMTIDTAWQGLMMGGVFTFMSVFLVRLGASSLMVSLLTSLPAVVMVLSVLPAAQYVQRQQDLVRFTNRVRIFHRGSIVLVAALPFVVREHLVEVIVAIWAVRTVTAAFLEPAWITVVADVIPAHRRASVNGARWALMSLVTALAVAGYGYLLERSSFPLGYQIVFLVSALGGVIGMYYWAKIRISPREPTPAPPLGELSIGGRARQYVRTFVDTPAFVRFLLTTFVLRWSINLPAALYSIYWIRHLDASDLWIGWQATAGKLALIAGYFVWGRAATRRGHHPVLLACTLGVGLFPALTATAPSQIWLPLVAAVQGFFVTGIDLAFFDTLLHVCPADKRSVFFAMNSVFMYLAMVLAPLAGSMLADWIGIRSVLYLAAAFHLVAVALFWAFRVGVEDDAVVVHPGPAPPPEPAASAERPADT